MARLALPQRTLLVAALLAMAAVQNQSCSSERNADAPVGGGAAVGGTSTGGKSAVGGAPNTGGASGSGQYVVAMVRSEQSNASDIGQDEIKTMVTDVVTQAGGLDFIQLGHTVVLKPNLLTTGSGSLPMLVNGVTTDWRVVAAVAELVRARVGTSGKVLVMEGSTDSTTTAYGTFGYTKANFGTLVDEFIALEGNSCDDKSDTGLVQRTSACSAKQMWVNQRYLEANWVISVAALKTHFQAGITGAVKNLGIGATPAGKYSSSGCGRTQNAKYIDHTPEPLSQFICDYYSVRPADFAIIDGLQGIQHGPYPAWAGGNYATDKMNMRLILAAKNAVALDTIAARVMQCDPKQVGHLMLLEALGFGTTDETKITVVGNTTVSAVKMPFVGPKLNGVSVCSK